MRSPLGEVSSAGLCVDRLCCLQRVQAGVRLVERGLVGEEGVGGEMHSSMSTIPGFEEQDGGRMSSRCSTGKACYAYPLDLPFCL